MSVDLSAVTAAEPGTPGGSTAAKTVGKYRLDRIIGSGGMGVVWMAFDPDLERSIALKLLLDESSEPNLRTRLLREARAMARLRHPNVVTVYDVGTDGSRDFIAMELVDGGTLDEWFDTKPARPEIIEVLIAAGKGLAAAHAAGLVHRDFKPHNVLRASDGHIYVTDFGLARGQIEDGPEVVQVALPVDEPVTTSRPRRKRDAVLDSRLTQTGVMIGTPAYMAPEQFAGRTPDPKSDQFAFCVTAWQALTGARPFRGDSVAELEAAARGGARNLVVDLPNPLRAVLERGLDPSPDQRWPDMPALLAALAAALDERPPPRRKQRVILAAAGATLVLGAGIATIAGLSGDREADLCVPADQAFAKAWGPERRAQQLATSSIGAVFLLDDLRRRWMQSYNAACEAKPRTKDITGRIHCLLDARDEIARAVSRLPTRRDDEGGLGEIAALTATVMTCDPSRAYNFGPFGEAPVPPRVPAPPISGARPGGDSW